MGSMAESLLRVMQDFDHQPHSDSSGPLRISNFRSRHVLVSGWVSWADEF